MREAIERPAYLVGCELEGGLAELLLDDVEGQAGASPLLQFALKELWANTTLSTEPWFVEIVERA